MTTLPTSSAPANAASSDPRAPAHVAIIMDGNGRWAKEKGVHRLQGHRQGAEAIRTVLEACIARGDIKILTLYAFSTENWQRDPEEVRDLMDLLRHYVKREAPSLHAQGIQLRFIGDRASLASDIQQDLLEVEALTASNTRLTLVVALSYGARQEMLQAIQRIASEVASGALLPTHVNETLLTSYLYTGGLPDPDLLIRTGGDQRLSNFLLWQSAYTELYFTERLWPDFGEQDLSAAMECYAQRERRFGRRPAQ